MGGGNIINWNIFKNINSLESNIWKYTIFLIANKRIFVAILGAYYLSIPDSTAQDVGLILFCGSLAGFIFEIPSGYFSDKIGHKQSLVFSRILMLLSTVFFLVADTLLPLILGGVFLSVSHSFTTGTGTAFMHETLRALGREGDYSKIMGKASSIGFAVPIPLMVLTPFLVSIDFRTPFIVALIIDIIGLIATISLVKPPVKPEHIEEINTTNFKQVVAEGYRLNFFHLAFFSAIISGALFSLSAFRPAYQVALGIPIIYYGIFFGIGRAAASLLLAYSGKIKNMFNIYSFLKFKLVFYTTLIFILGLFPNIWVVVTIFIVINAFQWGLSQVSAGFTLEIIKNSKFKATLLSTKSQMSSIISSVVSFAIGFVALRSSYQTSFLYLAIVFVATLLPLYLYIRKTNKFN